DQRMTEREPGYGRNWRSEERPSGYFGRGREEERGRFYGAGGEWERAPHERDEERFRASRWTGRDYGERERGHWPTGRERGYRPMAGDYGRGSEQFFAASGVGREDLERGRGWRERHGGEDL